MEFRQSRFNHRQWVWTELLAFDAQREGCGVGEYLQTLGFVPDGVSLLISTPDFILQHEGLDEDAILPPDVCARNGQEGNEARSRQEWTRFQLRNLVEALQREGCKVYFSSFTSYLDNRFHHEWINDYPEARVVSATQGRRPALFPLARLSGGVYLHDYFARQLAKVCEDYRFDGWHGADGYGPQWAIFEFGCGDNFVTQFAERGNDLPEFVTTPSDLEPEALTRRMDWIWRHRRLEWIEFYSDRWAEFWQAVVDALHAIGRKAMINSAWTKAPFEAKYRYGVDYRKIAATGVDAMMVETCAGGILLGTQDRNYHYDYLAMLMMIRACVPEMELICLLNVKDVYEDWDLLRHSPPMLEREVYSLANVYATTADGAIRRCADGFMACLADGISVEEWRWLADRFRLAFEPLPKRVHGATLLWADGLLDTQLATFPETRNPSAHYLLYRLLERNAPIQQISRVEYVCNAPGVLLVLNPHLFSEAERQRVINANSALILLGTDFAGWPEPGFSFRDGAGPGALELRFLNLPPPKHPPKGASDPLLSALPEERLSIAEPVRFRDELIYAPVSPGFLEECARLIQESTTEVSIENSHPHNLKEAPPFQIGMMLTEQADGALRLALKNSANVYGRPLLKLGRGVDRVRIRSSFPVARVTATEGCFKLVVPPLGIVVVDVDCSPVK